MFVEEPFAGYDGEYLRCRRATSSRSRSQKPHPPLWVACSRRETIHLAADEGDRRALASRSSSPSEAEAWVDDYYATLASDECVPGGFAVNPNLAVVLPMMCHEDEQTAIDRGLDGAHFFGYSLAHYYVFGEHRPGVTNVWDEFQENRSRFGFDRDDRGADRRSPRREAHRARARRRCGARSARRTQIRDLLPPATRRRVSTR